MRLPKLVRALSGGPERLPAEPESRFLPVSPDWTLEQCLQLMLRLSPGQRLSFFDPEFPSVSDPGGYVQVCRSRDGDLRRYTANHGWSTQWETTTPEALAVVLHTHRAAQGPGVQLKETRPPKEKKP